MKILNIIFLFAVLIGCKSQKPVQVAAPCPPFSETISKIDTVIEVKFTPKYVEKITVKEVEGKTVEIKTVDTFYVQSEFKILYRTHEVQVENTDKIKYAQYQRDSVINILNQQIKDNNALQSNYERLKGKNSTKIWWIGSLLLLLLLLLALWVRKQFSLKLPF